MVLLSSFLPAAGTYGPRGAVGQGKILARAGTAGRNPLRRRPDAFWALQEVALSQVGRLGPAGPRSSRQRKGGEGVGHPVGDVGAPAQHCSADPLRHGRGGRERDAFPGLGPTLKDETLPESGTTVRSAEKIITTYGTRPGGRSKVQ